MTESRWPIWTHYPLTLRRGSSDPDVYDQVFTGREYAILDGIEPPDLVIDCGAYAGYSAAYFLSRWPDCRLIAIEADADNARLCEANLAAYGDRAITHHSAIWSHGLGVKASSSNYRDGREWARQVRESSTPTIRSFDLNAFSALGRRLLVKMDIEGAEAVVFSAPDLSWIDRIACLVIELHDDSRFGKCSEIVIAAMASRGFATTLHGELTLFRRADRDPS